MNIKPMAFVAIGVGLYFVSHQLELRGDITPFAEGGASTERAAYHLMALVALIGAAGFFISAGVRILRNWR